MAGRSFSLLLAMMVMVAWCGVSKCTAQSQKKEAAVIQAHDGVLYLNGATSDDDDGVQKAVFVNGLDIIDALADIKLKQEANANKVSTNFSVLSN